MSECLFQDKRLSFSIFLIIIFIPINEKKVLFMHDIGTQKLLTFMKNRGYGICYLIYDPPNLIEVSTKIFYWLGEVSYKT